METAPVLHLNPAQVAQLIGYCTEYRSSLWRYARPTLERNQIIRCLQAFQGRLEKAKEQTQAGIVLPVTFAEKHTLKQLLSGLLHLYGNTFPSEQRNQMLGELAECKRAIQQMLSQAQPFDTQNTEAKP
jgi:hypothetical protein